MKTTSTLLLSLILIVSSRAGVLPPHATVFGNTIGDWTAAYYQRIYLASTNENPYLDPDGRWADHGQQGPVFFVAGFLVMSPGQTMGRHYAIPENKFVLVPVLIAYANNVDVNPPMSVAEMRALLASFYVPEPDLHFRLDGLAVPDPLQHRELSPVFSLDLQTADNPMTLEAGHDVVGLIDPEVADGYWVMLEPLVPGTYEFDFGGTYRWPGGASFERVDVVTVIEVPVPQWMAEFVPLAAQALAAAPQQRLALKHLQQAQTSFAAGHTQAGISHLGAFQKKVRALAGPADQATVEELAGFAQRIIVRAQRDPH